MATLFTSGRFQAIDASGVIPLAVLKTYAAGTLTPLATYTDQTEATPNPTTITCDANGQANVWLGSSSYRFRLFKADGTTLVYDTDNVVATASVTVADLSNAASASKGAALVGFNPALNYVGQTLGADLKTYPSLTSFTGVDATGVADSTSAIQAAVSLTSVRVPPGTYKVSSAITIPSNRSVIGSGWSCIFQQSSGDITPFVVTGSNVTLSNFKVRSTVLGTTVYQAAIQLNGATDCLVDRIELHGMSYHGVYLLGAAKRNTVRGCYAHDFMGTLSDASDVCIYSVAGSAAPAENTVTGNYLFGGCAHGVLVQDPYTSAPVLPTKNIINRNHIGQHTGYGVAIYMPNRTALFTASRALAVLTVTAVTSGTLAVGQDVFADTGAFYGRITSLGTGSGGTGTYNMDTSGTISAATMATSAPANSSNEVADNIISDIQGTANPAFGAGVYVVGAGAGGTVVDGNIITNCCVSTTDPSLAPGGIGINSIPLDCIPVQVSNNTITGMTKYYGINVSGQRTFGNVIGSDNSVVMPASNVTGEALRVNAASGTHWKSNRFEHKSLDATSTVVAIFANGVDIDRVSYSGNETIGGGFAQLRLVGSSGVIKKLEITGGAMTGSGTSGGAGLRFDAGSVTSGRVTGLTVETNTITALLVDGCTNLRFTGCAFNTTGATSLQLTGTCTGSYLDMSNSFNGAVTDTSTGFYKEVLTAAAPATGTWALPARAQNSVGAVGTSKGWRLTTAGSPGTWTSEGNL